MKVQINATDILATIDQLADQLMAAYPDVEKTVLVGIQQGGVVVSNLILPQDKSSYRLLTKVANNGNA